MLCVRTDDVIILSELSEAVCSGYECFVWDSVFYFWTRDSVNKEQTAANLGDKECGCS